MTVTAQLTDYWAELVSSALLGTDRRDPPGPPPGPLADLVADLSPSAGPAARLLNAAAATVVVRRAGLLPAAAPALLQPPPDDPRPMTPTEVSVTWARVVADWPVLEDEWTIRLIAHGWRLAPDLVVAALSRHRADAARHARALVASGPIGEWLLGLRPHLACRSKQVPSPEAMAAALTEVPELPIPPELVALAGRPGTEIGAALLDGFDGGTITVAHRAVLVNFIARVRIEALPPIAEALERVNPAQPTIGIAFALGELARLRHLMLLQLEPPTP